MFVLELIIFMDRPVNSRGQDGNMAEKKDRNTIVHLFHFIVLIVHVHATDAE